MTVRKGQGLQLMMFRVDIIKMFNSFLQLSHRVVRDIIERYSDEFQKNVQNQIKSKSTG